jgi:hypothetical protein
MAVWLWTVVPLLALHVWFWRRCRTLLRFQIALDAVLIVVVGPVLLLGADLNPVRCLELNRPFTDWRWAETTTFQPSQSDVVLQFHPWFEETRRKLLQRRPPWISERIGGGMPLFANGQIGLFAPVNLPLWALGPERGTTVMAFWKLELAGLGAFLLFWRAWRLRQPAAAVGAVAFAGGAYLVGWLLVPLSWVAASLPWLWWWATAVTRRRFRPWSVVGLGLACGWLMGGGLHPETAMIAVGSALVAGFVFHPRRWRRLVVVVVVSVSIAVALAWPTLGAIGGSEKSEWLRTERPNHHRPALSMRIDAVQQLVLPMVNGHPGRGDWQPSYPYPAAAVGIGGLALAAIVAGRVRRRYAAHRCAALVGLAAAAVLMYRVPPLDSLLVRVPPLSHMTLPRFGVLVVWGLAVWSALAVDGALVGRVRRFLWRAAAVLMLAAVALLAAPWRLAPFDLGLVGLTILAAASFGSVVRRPRWLAPMVAAELVLYAVGINPIAARADSLPRPQMVERLVDLQKKHGGRVMGLSGVFPANLAARYGLEDLRSYDPVRPRPYVRLMQLMGDPRPVLGGPLRSAPPRLCGAWSVRFLATPPGQHPAGWQPVWQGHGGRLWQNPFWLPEVRLAKRAVRAEGQAGWRLLADESLDFETEAVVPPDTPKVLAKHVALEHLELQSAKVRAEVRSDGPCLLVVARPWVPGWRARVDGEPAPLARANLAGLGVVVPSGQHQVELRYNPWSW